MNRSFAVVLGAGIALAAFGAQAQNPQPAPPGVTSAPMAPPNSPSPPPEKIAPPDRDAQLGNKDTRLGKRTLSDKLAEQHGMLQPPQAVDSVLESKPVGGCRLK